MAIATGRTFPGIVAGRCGSVLGVRGDDDRTLASAGSHVAAVLSTLRGWGSQWFDSAPPRFRPVLEAMVVMRVVEPASKLATWRMLDGERAVTSLPLLVGLEELTRQDLYRALDWRQARLRQGLNGVWRGALLPVESWFSNDLTSTWVTGHSCELAAYGYSRDGKRDESCDRVRPDLYGGGLSGVSGGVSGEYRRLCHRGRARAEKLNVRFGLSRVVWVGDRGMLTQTKIDTVLRPAGMSWVTSLRAMQIRKLQEIRGPWQVSLFDETGLIEVSSPDYPGERLVVCRNPLLAEERARKREELLGATERELDKIVAATLRKRAPLRGKAAIGLWVGKVIARFKMAKHFEITITHETFAYLRKPQQIEAEAALDGIYVLRTNTAPTQLSAPRTVEAYKRLACPSNGLSVRSKRSISRSDRYADRVRGLPVFLCMLAYSVEWQMRQKLKPLLFDDEEIPDQRPTNSSPVHPAERSDSAKQKDATGVNQNGMPVHSFRSLLADLTTVCYNVASTPIDPAAKIILTTRPTPSQQ
ncbi:MAG: IS1634 family transposase, partial [Methylococcales bacterium]